ncbi:MAG: AAA family ATPase [Patescibacteria group bacterium]
MLINPTTKRHVNDYLQTPFHALLIVGPKNSGKNDLVDTLVKGLVGSDLSTYPYKIVIDGENDGIEQVRMVKKEFSYKFVSKDSKHKRIVVINSIESIGRESHNAMLKLLEEPPEKTYIIATTTAIADLPSTILSRMKQLNTLPVTQETAISLKSNNTDSTDLAKKFISSKKYERLTMVNDLAKLEKQQQKEVMVMLFEIIYFKLSNSENTVEMRKLIKKIQTVETNIKSLSSNVNPKLIWLDLSLNL